MSRSLSVVEHTLMHNRGRMRGRSVLLSEYVHYYYYICDALLLLLTITIDIDPSFLLVVHTVDYCNKPR